ncbi:hypothetical protein [Psychrobacillus sp. FSL K6-1267]|uniref:hypothetical protein n=1 Tax=Psychrobacillus sp. FSL K6-1267 TaxID=2921543 RepID=UPI0030F781DA
MEQVTFTAEELKLMRSNGVPKDVVYQRIFTLRWDRNSALTTPITKGKEKGYEK